MTSQDVSPLQVAPLQVKPGDLENYDDGQFSEPVSSMHAVDSDEDTDAEESRVRRTGRGRAAAYPQSYTDTWIELAGLRWGEFDNNLYRYPGPAATLANGGLTEDTVNGTSAPLHNQGFYLLCASVQAGVCSEVDLRTFLTRICLSDYVGSDICVGPEAIDSMVAKLMRNIRTHRRIPGLQHSDSSTSDETGEPVSTPEDFMDLVSYLSADQMTDHAEMPPIIAPDVF